MTDKRKIRQTKINMIFDCRKNESHTNAAILYLQNIKAALGIETGL
jgi:hypothetical protein